MVEREQMARSDFRYIFTHRVRYDEIDGQQIVYNGKYLSYIDNAFIDYFRDALALPMRELANSGVFDNATVHAELDYYHSFGYDDLIEIGVRCEKIGTTSLTFAFEMWKHGEDEPYFRATIVYVSYDAAKQVKRPVASIVREAIARYEGWQRV